MAARVILSIALLGLCASAGRADETLCAGVNGVFSPDGASIAFQRDAGDVTRLGVCDLATKRITWVENGPGRAAFPAWAPDSTLVYSFGTRFHTAYETWQGNLGEGYGLRTWKDGVRKVLTCARRYDYAPCVAPDGRTLYWVSTKGSAHKAAAASDIGSSIWTGTLEDPERGTCIIRPAGVCSGVGQPAVSPNGRELAWAQLSDFGSSSWRIYLARTGDWSKAVPVSPSDMAAYAPAWSPGGTRLVFTGYRDGDPGWSIYLLDPAKGTVRRLLTGENASFAPDGRRLVYDDGQVLRLHALSPEDLK